MHGVYQFNTPLMYLLCRVVVFVLVFCAVPFVLYAASWVLGISCAILCAIFNTDNNCWYFMMNSSVLTLTVITSMLMAYIINPVKIFGGVTVRR